MFSLSTPRLGMIVGGAIVLALLVVAFFMYRSSNERYYITSAGGTSYKIDRRTGQTWLLRGSSLVPVDDSPSKPQPITAPSPPDPAYTLRYLPADDIAKLKGVLGYLGSTTSTFGGALYNGSDWEVRSITFQLGDRQLRTVVTIPGLSTKDVRVETGYNFYTSGSLPSWSIVSATGYHR